MKKNASHLKLLLFIFSLAILSCSDSIEPVNPISEDDNEIVNDDSSTDDDSGSNDDTSDDTNDDTSEGDNTGDDTNGNDTGGDDTSGDNNGGDDTNGDTNTGDGNTDATIVGNWRLVSAVVEEGQASTNFNGAVITFPFSSTSQDENVDITFDENPNVIMGMGQYTNVAQFTILGNAFTEETPLDSPLTNGNWEIANDNELIISGSDQANGTFIINELTANTLIIQTDFQQTVPTTDLELDVTGILVIELARN